VTDDTGWDLDSNEIWDAVWAADLDDPGPLADDQLDAIYADNWGPDEPDREPVGPPIDIDWLAVHDGDYPVEPED
jgi:hypothetical protein